MSGPCSAWVDLADVVADPRATKQDGTALDPVLLQEQIHVASEILYIASGRQFPGRCTSAVRPPARTNVTGPAAWWGPQGWYWPTGRQLYYGKIASRPITEITLGAYPVREIIEVRVDGEVLDPSKYLVRDLRWLVRTDGLSWPMTDDISKDPLVDLGTMRVAFEWGTNPPVGGVSGCRTYSIELAKGACGDECALPERIQSLQMGPGASFALLDPMTFLEKGRTGIYSIDVWLASVNPNQLRRRSSVINPDFARPVHRTLPATGS